MDHARMLNFFYQNVGDVLPRSGENEALQYTIIDCEMRT